MPRLPRPVAVAVATALAAGVLGVPTAGYAAYRHDVAQRGVLPVGSTVGGVDVGGLDREAAIRAVRAEVVGSASRRGRVRVGDRTIEATPRQLGITDDTEAAVDAAFDSSQRGSWAARAWKRVTGDDAPPVVDVTTTKASRNKAAALVAKSTRGLNVAARDASVQLVGGTPKWTDSRPGRRLDRKRATDALLASVADGKPREVALDVVKPKVTEAGLGTVLVVRTGTNDLRVYKDKRLVRTFDVATGKPGYETPLGRWTVTLKRFRPTWVNPGSEWGKDLPARIGPGPDNPLGTRALNLSANNIRIHGTPAASSIGYSASHGCIRMRMRDVEALYPMVPTGATVFVVRGGPPRPLGGASRSPADAADGG